MTIQRLVILQLLLFAGLGSAYFIPNQGKQQPVGVRMELPESIGYWTGVPEKVSQQELEQLAADTSFARRMYSNAFGDQLLTSIVLAGEDPDNSIHRPERCLPAQGWTVLDSKTVAIKTPVLATGNLKVTRLYNERKFKDNSGKIHSVYNLNYYWFVGYRDVTPSHIDRALMDIRDRITKGYNQRWAYVTVASNISEGFVRFGRSEGATDQMIQSFIQDLLPQIVQPSVLGPNAVRDGRSAEFHLNAHDRGAETPKSRAAVASLNIGPPINLTASGN
jgi:EpsI family protein